MREGLLYLDTSAIVKLVLPEPETEELLHLLSDCQERVTSGLARVEVLRAVRRAGEDGAVFRRAEEVLARLGLIEIGTSPRIVASRPSRYGLDDLISKVVWLPAPLRFVSHVHLRFWIQKLKIVYNQ